MKTSDIEELLLKSGKSAYQAGPLNEETEENTQYGRLPKAYVTDGIFVKPAKEDMKLKVNYTDIVWIEAENNITALPFAFAIAFHMYILPQSRRSVTVMPHSDAA